jgi:hypothetical protein
MRKSAISEMRTRMRLETILCRTQEIKQFAYAKDLLRRRDSSSLFRCAETENSKTSYVFQIRLFPKSGGQFSVGE